ncbi:MAG TPA: outer membrane beta-barrel protein [Gemmatimonadales bacterium]|nr:outer membrane beta-barrel protein [Gemmatimonadales bacterium]
MRITAAFLVLTCFAVATSAAQATQSEVEIGTSLGVTTYSRSGSSSVTVIGVPAGVGPAAQPSIYATFFVTPSVMIEPQLSFAHLSGSGSSTTMVDLGAQLGYLVTPSERSSPYVAANVAWQTISDVSSFHGVGVGGALGYRARIGRGFAVRFEARYRHWMGDFDGLNEIGFGIGLGGII